MVLLSDFLISYNLPKLLNQKASESPCCMESIYGGL